jgi:hypothetical protein
MKSICFALFLVMLSGSNADDYGNYPSTYPFASEEYGEEFLTLPDTGMPEFTFDDKDTGGYYLYGAIKQTFDNQDGPDFYSLCDSMDCFWFPEHLGFGLWNMKFLETASGAWNCTAAGNSYSAEDFPGTQNGDSVCTGSECCSQYEGEYMFGDDTQTRQQLFADFVAANGCDTMPVEVYCVTGDSWHWVCLEGYVTRVERLLSKPCYDGFVKLMQECSLLKVTGAHSYLEAIFCEPQSYIDSLTALQTFTIYSIEYTTFDRVCHPYSYYHPDGDADDGDDTAAAASLALLVCSVCASLLYA